MKRTEYPVCELRLGHEEDIMIYLKSNPIAKIASGIFALWMKSYQRLHPWVQTQSYISFKIRGFHPSLIHWRNKGDSRIRSMAISVNVSHLLLFSGPCLSQVVAHSGSSYAHFSSSITHLKITPTNSLNTHATSHSNTVSHIHTSGTTLYPLLPFFLWGTACVSSLCSKLIAFLLTIDHRGFFAFYPFPILQSLCHKSPSNKSGNL